MSLVNKDASLISSDQLITEHVQHLKQIENTLSPEEFARLLSRLHTVNCSHLHGLAKAS